MRQVLKFVILSIMFSAIPCHAGYEGGVEYSIPIDYKNMNQEELENKAGFYYNLALKTKTLNEEMTFALNLYTMLNNKCPDNILYPIRLGNLYDTIGNDRLAKSNYYKAMGIDSANPETYFCFGEYYYKRSGFKKALKMYKEAYKLGYTRHYETVYKLGDVYEKLGDTEAALKYLNLASELSPNAELDSKISRLQSSHALNNEYYKNTRIHNIER